MGVCFRNKILLLIVAWMIWPYGCAGPTPPPQPPGHPKPYRVGKNWYQPLPHAKGFEQKGLASWYGEKFHGRKTASGEIYNMHAMSAAHKTLPLGTYVRVRNLNNGKSIDVRVNDRGPFVQGRIIDLSYTAAKRLDIIGPGTAPVVVTALGVPAKNSHSQGTKRAYKPVNYEKGPFFIQVGAFLEKDNAKRLYAKLDRTYRNAHISTYFDGRQTFYRVRVGRCYSLSKAAEYEQIMIDHGYLGAMIVAE